MPVIKIRPARRISFIVSPSGSGCGARIDDLAPGGAHFESTSEQRIVVDQHHDGVGDFLWLDNFRWHPALEAVLRGEFESPAHQGRVDDARTYAVDADFLFR